MRIAKWNQRVLGGALLTVAYLLGIGPSSLALRGARFAGFARESAGGWGRLEPREGLAGLKEQS